MKILYRKTLEVLRNIRTRTYIFRLKIVRYANDFNPKYHNYIKLAYFTCGEVAIYHQYAFVYTITECYFFFYCYLSK